GREEAVTAGDEKVVRDDSQDLVVTNRPAGVANENNVHLAFLAGGGRPDAGQHNHAVHFRQVYCYHPPKLRAGQADDHLQVVERHQFVQSSVGERSFGQIGSQAAAVHDGEVGTGDECTHPVGIEVADRTTLVA